MNNEPKVTFDMLLGTVEVRSWMEATYNASGDLVLVGRGCKITRDRNGKVTDATFSDTGVTCTMPVGRGKLATWFDRAAKWLRPNARIEPGRCE